MNASVIIRWIARVWSIASTAWIVAFVVGSESVPSPTEAVALLFFPVGVVLGMAIAWRYEWIGGTITTMSLAVFYLWLGMYEGRWPRGPYFLLLAMPGFLFLGSWLLDSCHLSIGRTKGHSEDFR